MAPDDDATAGEDPAVESTDDELLEAAAVAEQDEDDGVFDALDLDPAVIAGERDEYRNTLMRVKAEFDNYKKRAAREEIEVRERAAEALADKLLVVLDACDAAIGHGAEDVGPIAKMLADVLEREGLVRLVPEGQPFDPNQHDAVMHEPGDGGEALVVETLRTGYQWKGRVIRPAMVKVRG